MEDDETWVKRIALAFREHRSAYARSVGSLALVLQLVLFYAIVRKSPVQFRVFKNLVLLDNTLAFLFNLMCMIFEPTADSKGGHIFLLFDGPFGHLPQPFNCWLWMFFLFVMLSTVVVLPLQYIYRYMLICRQAASTFYRPLTFVDCRKVTITTRRFVLMFFLSVLVIAVHCFIGQWVFAYNQQPEVQREFGRLLAEDPYWAVDMPVFTVLVKSNPLVIAHFFSLIVILGVSYALVVFCSRRILVELRYSVKLMSRATREINNQLSLLLFVQAAVPFVSLSLPVLIHVSLSLAGISVANAAMFLTTFISWAPVVDALATLLIVTPYRNFLLFLCLGRKSKAELQRVTAIKQPYVLSGLDGERRGSLFLQKSSSQF